MIYLQDVYRKAARLTQLELSELSGIPTSTISSYENGIVPSLLNAKIIANILRVKVDDLIVLSKSEMRGGVEKCEQTKLPKETASAMLASTQAISET